MSSGQKQGPRAPAAALAPGFRFHPTDEELVGYYLKRKISGKPFRVDAISDVDLYKSEPWDLPGKSRIQSRDMEWYFFSALDKKYANRSRTNRATGSGYWKTTGKDRPIFQRAWPQNGAQYGAPFVEEEWEGDGGEPVVEEDDGEVTLKLIDAPLVADMDEFEQTQDGSVQDQTDLVDFNSLIAICDGQVLAGAMDGNIGDYGQLTDQSQGLPLVDDEFLELNDFAPSPEALTMEDIFNSVVEVHGFSELFPMDQAADGSSYLEVNDILGAEPRHYSPPGVNGNEEELFFDAPTLYPEANFLDSLASGSGEPDLVDELIAYFDATENMAPSEAGPSASNDPVCLLFFLNIGEPRRSPSRRESPQTPEFTPPRGVGFVNELADGRARGVFSERLISMLGAISSPPALAAEEGAADASLEKNLAAFSPGSIRVTPAIIQSWRVEKNAGDVGFLAYGGFEKPPKNIGLLSFIQRNSFHLLFLSVLLLAASFKICVCVYSARPLSGHHLPVLDDHSGVGIIKLARDLLIIHLPRKLQSLTNQRRAIFLLEERNYRVLGGGKNNESFRGSRGRCAG
ncbi:unnamed protein product [Spirodela intermedia]|uniref:NAC domain-containing protein n=1 Tax=Spirodela intermedia TaxID=51605 RepID=A0A7I8IZK5_SPIIN|nr:unnamed protein product [Spirodela intermedia]CAA6662591.1 unnamed protein product [Spirodela intermedia]